MGEKVLFLYYVFPSELVKELRKHRRDIRRCHRDNSILTLEVHQFSPRPVPMVDL